jgi:hypothetical protein
MSDSIKRSVDSLQKIYAVIIALAIGEAIKATIGTTTAIQTNQQGIMALVSLFALIVPFYHGMNRHLDICYLETPNPKTKGALLLDFLVFCVEACLLFAFVKHIHDEIISFIILGLILAVDILWGIFSHFIHYSKMDGVIRWALINIATIIAGLVIFSSDCLNNKPMLLMILSILRTFADYGFCWSFYFPKD